MSASVEISAVICANELTSAIVGPASTAPVVALKPKTLPSLSAFNGN